MGESDGESAGNMSSEWEWRRNPFPRTDPDIHLAELLGHPSDSVITEFGVLLSLLGIHWLTRSTTRPEVTRTSDRLLTRSYRPHHTRRRTAHWSTQSNTGSEQLRSLHSGSCGSHLIGRTWVGRLDGCGVK
jgi:hypothetical protein